ncbi:MAG: N-acetylmuramoyl-L-alanine amidase, partial [Epsilonproteobacteria bacterium]|nr:N-acetylmuramoyl-L-alanine amidase [Campylobacterota bacterium]
MVKIAQNRPDRVRVVISGKLDSDARLSGNIYKIPLKINTNPSFESTSANSKQEFKSSNAKNIEHNELDTIFSGIQKAPKIRIEDCKVSAKKNKNSDSSFKSKEQFIKEPTESGNVIVIDAGHGGKDPGAISGGMKEKDVTLAVAKKLGRILANRGYKVYLTRDDDRFITLEQRTKMADKKDAKIFVSLHCNAAPNKRAANNMYGIETFFLQRSKDARSQA